MKTKIFTLIFVMLIVGANLTAATINITANTLWSAIVTGSGPGGQPNSTDNINVHGGVVLTLDIAGATANIINLGSNSIVPIGDGTLLFNPGTDLTTSGLINLGDVNRRGIIDMTNGGVLTTVGTVLTGNANRATLFAGTGAIVYTGTFTLPNSTAFNTFNIVTINGGTVTTNVTSTFNGNLTVNSGSTFRKADAITTNGDIDVFGTWNNTGSNNITANGNMILENGALYNTTAGVTTTLTMTGNLTMRGATINRNTTGNGRFIVGGNANIESGTNVNTGGRWEVSGLMDIQAGAIYNFNIDNAGNTRLVGSLSIGAGASLLFTGAAVNLPVTGNLIMDGGNIGGTAITTGVQVAGSATINSGINTVAGQLFTVAADLNIKNGATLIFNNTSGTKTFNNVNIDNGGTWNSAVSRVYNIKGSLLNDGTLTANSGIYTFAGSGQTISGSSVTNIPQFRINGAGSSYTNNGSLNVSTSWSGNGDLTNGANAYLNFGGTITSSGILVASSIGNTVEYSATIAQTMRSITYHHLVISNAGVTSATGAVTLNGDLSVTGGTLDFAAAITGNATGLITLNAGTRLELSGVASLFPTAYVAANIALDPTSTVRYESSSAAQTISRIPTYGNLEIAQTGAAVTKTLATAGAINIASDLTIVSPVTFNLAANTANLSGSLLGTGNFTMSTGTLNIAGAWTNNGTFTKGTSTVNWNGSSSQTIVALNYHHLTSSSTGTRTIANSGTVGISGVFTPGTNVYTITNSTVSFNGTVAQTVPAFTFFNHTIANLAGVALAGNVNLENTLTLSSGAFTTTGFNYTLLSTSANTARIATITAGSIVGNIIMQRFTPGGTTGWALLGAPINAVTLAQWQDDFAMSGFTGVSLGVGGFISVYTYNEAAPGVFDNPAAYIAATNVTNALTKGKGYWVYLGNGTVTTTDINIDVTGAPHTGNFNFGVTRTVSGGPTEDGWNLVANPYPSAIDWNAAAGWTKTNMSGTIQIWNADVNQYAVWDGVSGTNGATRNIASSQGFYVQATGAAPVLSSTESVKTAVNPTMLRQGQDNGNGDIIRFMVDGNSFHDETLLKFVDGASNQFIETEDVVKFKSRNPLAPTFTQVVEGKNIALNKLAADNRNVKIDLALEVGIAGNYTLSFEGIDLFPQNQCILLEDLKTKQIIDIRAVDSYNFTINENEKGIRFVVTISSPLDILVSDLSCGKNNDGSIEIKTPVAGWSFDLFNADGQVIESANLSQKSKIENLVAGNYNLHFNNSSICNNLDKVVVINAAPFVKALAEIENIEVDNKTMKVVFINKSENGTSTWDFGDGETVTSKSTEVEHIYQNKGTYTVKLTVKSGACSEVQNIVVRPTESASVKIQTSNNEEIKLIQLNEVYQLQFNFDSEQIVNIDILNAAGQLIQQQSIVAKNNSQTIDMNGNAQGIYFVKVYNKQGNIYSGKLVK